MAVLWIIAATSVLVLLARPGTRILGAALGAVLLVILLWAMQRSDFGGVLRNPARPESTPAARPGAPPLNSVRIEGLELAGSGAPWRFSGTVANLSQHYRINSAIFEITRADCYEGAGTPDGCQVVWRGQHTVTLDVPPQQMRNFTVEMWLRGSVLRLKGVAKDQFVLIRLTGAPTDSD